MFIIGLFQLDAPASDPQADALLLRFNDVAQESKSNPANRAFKQRSTSSRRPWTIPETINFGQFHLRLGQLYKAQGRNALSAYHFLRCHQDRRVVAVWTATTFAGMDCRDVTATLTVTDLPAGGEVIVIEPKEFEGPLKAEHGYREVG